jgi:hypothetical protein
MRPVTTTDLIAAARVLLAFPEAKRPVAMRVLVARAQIADRHRLTTGRLHPAYGNGTLLAAALAHGQQWPDTSDEATWLECLASAIDGVLEVRSRCDG